MYRVLIVEDNQTIREELKILLENYGYVVEALGQFEDVPSQILKTQCDVVLLDLTLPGVDGHFIAQRVRKESQVPIIVVTSRDNAMDELMAMNMGVDDYITKPYNIQILLARLQAVLRRSYENKEVQTQTINGVELDSERMRISKEVLSIELTKNEVLILSYLYQKFPSVVTREALMQHLWDTDWFVDDNTLSVNINRLRKKLEEIGAPDFIETKRGMGYALYETA